MPLIDTADITAKITARAQQQLVKKPLGGVSRDSADKAIEQAAHEALLEGNKRIGSLELLVEDKDRSICVLKESMEKQKAYNSKINQELQDKLDTLNKQLAQSNAIKVGKPKTLPNGNIETIRVNKNGFRETTERLADGRKVSKKFENIDGDILKITYDPSTEKPLKVFSNINGDTLTEYNGDKITTKAVNNKKVLPKKPELIKTEMLKDESKMSSGISKIRRSYSDGSYDMIDYSHYRQYPIKEVKINKAGKVYQETEYKFYDHYKISTTSVLDPKKQRAKVIISKRIYDKDFEPKNTYINEDHKFTDDNCQIYKKVIKYNNGLVRIIEAKKDEYGFLNTSNPSLKIIYPKNSKIKSSEVKYRSQFDPSKETLKMRDGSTVTMSIDSNYNPYDVVISDKQGNNKILESGEEIREYMTSIGKNAGINSSDYYYNVLR